MGRMGLVEGEETNERYHERRTGANGRRWTRQLVQEARKAEWAQKKRQWGNGGGEIGTVRK